MARFTFQNANNGSAGSTATAIDSQALATDNRIIRKLIVGKPTAAGVITLYNDNNAVGGSTSNIAFQYTYPTFGAGTPASDQFDFSGGPGGGSKSENGLNLDGGGSITTSAAMAVTVLWENPDDD